MIWFFLTNKSIIKFPKLLSINRNKLRKEVKEWLKKREKDKLEAERRAKLAFVSVKEITSKLFTSFGFYNLYGEIETELKNDRNSNYFTAYFNASFGRFKFVNERMRKEVINNNILRYVVNRGLYSENRFYYLELHKYDYVDVYNLLSVADKESRMADYGNENEAALALVNQKPLFNSSFTCDAVEQFMENQLYINSDWPLLDETFDYREVLDNSLYFYNLTQRSQPYELDYKGKVCLPKPKAYTYNPTASYMNLCFLKLPWQC